MGDQSETFLIGEGSNSVRFEFDKDGIFDPGETDKHSTMHKDLEMVLYPNVVRPHHSSIAGPAPSWD